MTKTEFLEKWIPRNEDNALEHIIPLNYAFTAMSFDLDELILWAKDEGKREHTIDLLRGKFHESPTKPEEPPKETDGIWTATNELRWQPMSNPSKPITKLLQQKWINYTEIKIQWRTVPMVNE